MSWWNGNNRGCGGSQGGGRGRGGQYDPSDLQRLRGGEEIDDGNNNIDDPFILEMRRRRFMREQMRNRGGGSVGVAGSGGNIDPDILEIRRRHQMREQMRRSGGGSDGGSGRYRNINVEIDCDAEQRRRAELSRWIDQQRERINNQQPQQQLPHQRPPPQILQYYDDLRGIDDPFILERMGILRSGAMRNRSEAEQRRSEEFGRWIDQEVERIVNEMGNIPPSEVNDYIENLPPIYPRWLQLQRQRQQQSSSSSSSSSGSSGSSGSSMRTAPTLSYYSSSSSGPPPRPQLPSSSSNDGRYSRSSMETAPTLAYYSSSSSSGPPPLPQQPFGQLSPASSTFSLSPAEEAWQRGGIQFIPPSQFPSDSSVTQFATTDEEDN